MKVIICIALCIAVAGAAVPNILPCDGKGPTPYPGDCTKFLICSGAFGMPENCAAGLHFNAKTAVCDDPEIAGCETYDSSSSEEDCGPETTEEPTTTTEEPTTTTEEPTTTTEEPTTTTTEATTTEEPTTITEPTTTEDGDSCNDEDETTEGNTSGNGSGENQGICPSDMNSLHLIPHATDCTKFYSCVWGTPVEMDCPAGLHFNPALMVCDWPQDAGCEASGASSSSEEDTAQDETLAAMCSTNKKSAIHLLAHPTECGKFVSCIFGKAVAMTCSNGQHFNAAIGVCDAPENAGCEAVPTENFSALCAGNKKSILHLVAHPTECGKFVTCMSGKGVAMNCANGQHFNAALGVCDAPEKAGCEAVPTENFSALCAGNKKSILHLVAHPTECGKFVSCMSGKGVAMNCANGQHFNAVLGLCDAPENAGCEAVPTENFSALCAGNKKSILHLVAHPTECGKFVSCMSGKGVAMNCANGQHFNAALGLCDAPENAGCEAVESEDDFAALCPADKSFVIVAHPTECGNFISCMWGKPVVMSCLDGSHFNPIKGICDAPENAGCVEVFDEEIIR